MNILRALLLLAFTFIPAVHAEPTFDTRIVSEHEQGIVVAGLLSNRHIKSVVATEAPLQPTLNLDFAPGTGVLDPLVNFTRATTARAFDCDGVLQTFASGAARVDSCLYNGSTWINHGLLIEESRINLLFDSENFSQAAGWTAVSGGVTLTSNAAVAPDGNITADKFARIDGSDGVAQSVALTGGEERTLSIFTKNIDAGRGQISIFHPVAGDYVSLQYNWSSGVPSTHAVVGAYNVRYEDADNGWYRIQLTFIVTSGSPINSISFITEIIGSGTEASYYWGADLELGAEATSYIHAITGAVTRAADVATVTDTGWLNTNEGTLLVKMTIANNTDHARRGVSINNGTSSNQIALGLGTAGGGRPKYTMSGETPSLNISAPADWSNGDTKTLVGNYQVGISSFATGGIIVGATTLTALPSGLDRLTIGGQGGGGMMINDHVEIIQYWPEHLDTGYLQARSQ